MTNESKETKASSAHLTDLPTGETVFPSDSKWLGWVNSVVPQALASCLQHLNEAGPEFDTTSNREAIQAVTHNLAKLDAGIVMLNNSFLSAPRKQAVLASMLANPYFAENIVSIGVLLDQLNGDFLADFSAVKKIARFDGVFKITDALQILSNNDFLNPQHRSEWFDFVIGDALARTGRRGNYAQRMASIYARLRKNDLLTGERAERNFKALREKNTQSNPWDFIYAVDELNFDHLSFKQLSFDLIVLNHQLKGTINFLQEAGLLKDPEGENNLERLRAVGGNLHLAAAVSDICRELKRAGCLTQANLDALLILVEAPALHGRLRAIAVAMEVKECKSSQEMQDFFTRLIQTSVATAGEVKKDNKAGNESKSQKVSLDQSLNGQRTDDLIREIKQVVPALPTVLVSLISHYAGNWYSAEDNEQLLLAQQYVVARDEASISQHAQQAVCKGWLGVFAYYIETGYVRHNDVLLEGDVSAGTMANHLRSRPHRIVLISPNRVMQNGVRRFFSYLMLALKNGQSDMVRLILAYEKEYYENEPSADSVGIQTVEMEYRPPNSWEQSANIETVCCCKGSVLYKAMLEKDVASVQLWVTHGANPLSREYPPGTYIRYGEGSHGIVDCPAGSSDRYRSEGKF